MKKILLIVSVLVLSLSFSGCGAKAQQEETQTAFILNTVSQITLYNYPEDSDPQDIISRCFELCSDYEKKLSRTIETSEISKINSAHGEEVEVSEDTAELIKLGIKFGDISKGKFDISIDPVSTLWDFQGTNPVPPDDEEIKEKISHVNYKNIRVNGNKVKLLDSEAAIDLGGIAKGFIGDKAKEFLEEQGVTKAYISLGGNVLVICPENDSLKIGIQKPFGKDGELDGAVATNKNSIVTSGIYERYFEYDGKFYHHILDTSTGYPVENNLNAVTIIGPSSAWCDALSTTVFCLGEDEGLKLINSLDGYEGILITKDNKSILSDGIGKSVEYRAK